MLIKLLQRTVLLLSWLFIGLCKYKKNTLISFVLKCIKNEYRSSCDVSFGNKIVQSK